VKGAIAIADALSYNPSLSRVFTGYKLSGLDDFMIDTFHNLEGLLNSLIGEDGARVLASGFRIKSRCVTFVR
jgi:hypothetical protein